MISLNDLGKLLDFDEDFYNLVLNVDLNLTKVRIDYYVNGFSSKNFDSFYQESKEEVTNDTLGLKILKLMLLSAINAYGAYEKLGIDRNIYISTMKCFSRFTYEHKISYNVYGFDRAFWTARQTSLTLFRLGELEYEMVNNDNEKSISIHIPSDAKLTKENIDCSIKKAKSFFRKYFPDFANVKYYCESWLLSPILTEQKMLPLNSNIMTLRSYFDINDSFESEDYKEWVFKDRNIIDLTSFRCETRLQQKIKDYILLGNKFTNGIGELKL